MFVILLEFSANRAAAGQWMDAHNAWLAQGFDEGVFQLAGSLVPGRGGALIATGESREAIEGRVAGDPFVAEDVVRATVHEIAPARVSAALAALQGAA